jgi:hypothetical protein
MRKLESFLIICMLVFLPSIIFILIFEHISCLEKLMFYGNVSKLLLSYNYNYSFIILFFNILSTFFIKSSIKLLFEII